MTLLKDLINLHRPALAEGQHAFPEHAFPEHAFPEHAFPEHAPERARFNRIFALIERDLEHLRSITKQGSTMEALVEKLGGDLGFLKAAREALAKLDAAMLDLHMSVGLAIERDPE